MDSLQLLLLEDEPEDAALILRTLQKSGMTFESKVVDCKESFIAALDHQNFDVILSDNSLPHFSAKEALAICSKRKVDIPFILVTGSISEEYAVDIMKEGVYDYVLKDRLKRLPSAVVNAMSKWRAEKERKKYIHDIVANESVLNEAELLAHYGSWAADLLNNHHRWSDGQYRILGYEPGAVMPSLENFLQRIYYKDVERIRRIIEHTIQSGSHEKYDFRVVDNHGSLKYISAEMVVKRDANGKAFRVNGFIRDVSQIRLAEMKEKQITADLLQRNKDLEQFSYIVSHNLRAPVANIVGISNAFNDYSLTEAERGDFMKELSSCVTKLDSVIIDLNHILQVRNNVNEKKEKVKFSEVVGDIIKVMSANGLNNKNEVVSCDFSEVDEVSTLKSYIHSIFYNLISNSIKFRQQGMQPFIEISSSKSHGKVKLLFKDNGIGIDLEKKGGHIFGLYKRFHPDYADGKGMGLFMVKTQVESLGGKISVASAVKVGTEFSIEFDQGNLIS